MKTKKLLIVPALGIVILCSIFVRFTTGAVVKTSSTGEMSVLRGMYIKVGGTFDAFPKEQTCAWQKCFRKYDAFCQYSIYYPVDNDEKLLSIVRFFGSKDNFQIYEMERQWLILQNIDEDDENKDKENYSLIMGKITEQKFAKIEVIQFGNNLRDEYQ